MENIWKFMLVLLITHRTLSDEATKCVAYNQEGGICVITVKCDGIPDKLSEEIKKRTEECTRGTGNSATVELEITNLRTDEGEKFDFLIKNNTITKLILINGTLQSILPFLYNASDNTQTILLKNGHIEAVNIHKIVKTKTTSIDISNNLISKLEETDETSSFGDQLKDIDLSYNLIQNIANDYFRSFTQLQTIKLAFNNINVISENAFRSLKKLTQLDLANNHLNDIKFNKTDLAHLETFTLQHNKITYIKKDTFDNLVSLLELDVSNNEIIEIEEQSFYKLKKLKNINLSNNEQIMINTHFENLANLENVNLKHVFNVNFQNAKNTIIKKIDLSSCSITNLSAIFINRLKNLNTLQLQNNTITVLDNNSFEHMTSLEVLDLSENNINIIDDNSFHDTKELKLLDLHGNQIDSWNSHILENLIKLKKINLRRNKLSDFIPWDLPNSVSKIDVILDDNEITNLRFREFSDSNKVSSLSIGGNPISCLNINDSLTKYPNLGIKAELNNDTGIACGTRLVTNYDVTAKTTTKTSEATQTDATISLLTTTATPHTSKEAQEQITNCVALIKQNDTCVVHVSCLGIVGKTSAAIESGVIDCTESHSNYFLTLNFNMEKVSIITPDDIKELNASKIDQHGYIKKIQMKNGTFELALILIEKIKNIQEMQVNFAPITSINLHNLVKENVTAIDLSNNSIQNLDGSSLENIGHNLRNLNLSYNRLETIPADYFQSFTELKTLDLSHNLIIGKLAITAFQGLHNLKTLILSYNNLSNLDTYLYQFEYLKHLWLDNNKIINISKEHFEVMKQLEFLDLHSNVIDKIDIDAFDRLGSLRFLDISNNKVTEISKDMFKANRKLSDLNLSSNNISRIEPNSFKNNKIEKLSFENNDLRGGLDKSVFEGLLISQLSLSNIKMFEIKDEYFSPLAATLTQLKLSNNDIKTVSKNAFKNLKRLKELDLSHNNLNDIQFNTRDLQNLEKFTINNNNISGIKKDTFVNLVSLLELDMSHNKINEIEPQSFETLKKLQKVDLNNNKLQKLAPEMFGNLENVILINVDFNDVSLIEKNTFFGMKKLTNFSCAHNKLVEIDNMAFENTEALRYLNLTHNYLTQFRIVSDHVANLRELDLNDNKLDKIPELGHLTNLQFLHLGGNNIVAINSMTLLPEIRPKNNLPDPKSKRTRRSMGSAVNVMIFKNLPSLKLLDLSRNSIQKIQNDTFKDATQLEELNLNMNEIKEVDSAAFFGLHKLRFLDLSENKINNINDDSFQDTKELKILDLHGNQIDSWRSKILQNLNKMERLNLKNNKLSDFVPWDLPTSEYKLDIILDDNDIKNLRFDEFSESNKVKSFSLGGNPISCININDSITKYPSLGIKAELNNVTGIACGNILATNYNLTFKPTAKGPEVTPTATIPLLTKTATPLIPKEKQHDQITNCVALRKQKNTCVVEVSCLGIVGKTIAAIESGVIACTDSRFRNYLLTLNFNMEKVSNITPDKIKELNASKIDQHGHTRKIQLKNGTFELALILIEKMKNIQEIQVNFASISSINLHNLVKENVTAIDLSNNSIQNLDGSSLENTRYNLHNLNLSYNRLKTIPADYFLSFTELKTLDLSHNSIIGKLAITAFQGLHNLKTLILSYNNLSNLDTYLYQFEYLEHLSLDNNKINNIPKYSFDVMKQLEFLDLHSNVIDKIDIDAFGRLESLRFLDISNNKVTEIRKDMFKANRKLSDLNLSYNNISRIEPNSFKNNKIEKLTFENNDLRGGLDKSVFEGLLISQLSLNNIKMFEIKDEYFSPLAATLTQLKLSNNDINTVSKNAFKNFKKLKELDLSHNNLNDIQFNTKDLQSLEEFTINNNNISSIKKDTFVNLVSLLELDMSHNKINEIEQQSFGTVKKLQKIDLNNNKLQKLSSETFGSLDDVIVIKVDFNDVSSIKKETFFGMKKLTNFSCAHNQLMDIDNEVFEYAEALRYLNLSHNYLTQFKIDSGHVANLRELDLNGNKLDKIPELGHLTNLQFLRLGGNNIVAINSMTLLPVIKPKNNFDEPKSIRTRRSMGSAVNVMTFKNLPSLKLLDLSENKIQIIQNDTFKDATQLEQINLNTNEIEKVDIAAFFGLPNLMLLDLSENKIRKIHRELLKDTKKIEILDLHHNLISTLSPYTLSNQTKLRKLNLMSNKLTDFGPWYLPRTEAGIEVILDENEIENLRFEEFSESTKVLSLSIGGNPIPCENIKEAIFTLSKMSLTAQVVQSTLDNINGIGCGKKQHTSKSSTELPVFSSASSSTVADVPSSSINLESLLSVFLDKFINKTRDDTFHQHGNTATSQPEYKVEFDKLASSELDTFKSLRVLIYVIASFMGIIAVILVAKSVYAFVKIRKQAS